MLTKTEKEELTKRVTEYAEAEMMVNARWEGLAEQEAAVRGAAVKLQNLLRYIEEIS